MKAGKRGLRTQAAPALTLCLLVVAGGCSGIESGSVWAPQSAAVYTLGSSYGWLGPAYAPASDGAVLDPPFRQLIREMVERGFACKGYEKTAHDAANFWIGCEVKGQERGTPYDTAFREYIQVTLAVYIVDPGTNRTLWRGWAQARLRRNIPPANKRERLEQAFHDIFEDFPLEGRPLRKGES